ncbi:MAG: tRNA (adenosine(37)-N6)-threonylcarbamoyltransferase complex ATPase subunit type 1 TsaE [Bdellovibrionales bacterium]
MSEEIRSLTEFKTWVRRHVSPRVGPRVLFLLEGEVGAGKTELVKTLCEERNLFEVQSPTFAFHHCYSGPDVRLHHVDLYRAKSEEDLESTGFWDLFQNEDDTIIVEWADRLQGDVWPWNWTLVRIQIEKLEGERRRVSLLSRVGESPA